MEIAFTEWALRLGFPRDCIPSETALQSVFKSPQGTVLEALMRDVHPREDIERMRRELYKDGRLPKETKTAMEVKSLEKERDALQMEIDALRKEFVGVYTTIQKTNTECTKKSLETEIILDKTCILQLKKVALEADVEKERKNSITIKENIPMLCPRIDSSIADLANPLDKAQKALDSFYKNESCTENQNLWLKLCPIYAGIPISAIFTAANNKYEECLSADFPDQGQQGIVNQTDIVPSFDLERVKMRAKILGLAAKHLLTRKKRILVENRLSCNYTQYGKDKLGLSGDDNSKKLMKFVISKNIGVFADHLNEYIKEQTAHCSNTLQSFTKQLSDHESLIKRLKQTYESNNMLINRIQYEVLQLGHIKHKILYTKQTMDYFISQLHSTPIIQQARGKLQSTDVENSDELKKKLAITSLRKEPNHVAELKCVAQLSLGNADMLSQCWRTYQHEAMLLKTNNEQLDNVSFALFSGHQQRAISSTEPEGQIIVNPDLSLIAVDQLSAKVAYEQQMEFIDMLMDKIISIAAQSSYKLERIEKLWNIVESNALRNFISKSRQYNHKSYFDYEADFNLYYDMLSKDVTCSPLK